MDRQTRVTATVQQRPKGHLSHPMALVPEDC